MGSEDALIRKSNYEKTYKKGPLVNNAYLGEHIVYRNPKNNAKIFCIEQ